MERRRRTRASPAARWIATARVLFDRHGDGEVVLGIRSAAVDGPRASMWAGVGLVDGSETAAELAETQFKLQALLAAIVRP